MTDTMTNMCYCRCGASPLLQQYKSLLPHHGELQEHLTHPPDGAQEVIGYVTATATTVFLHLHLVQHKHRRGGGG